MKRWHAAHPLHLVIGQALWLAWFAFIYGAMSVACAAGAPFTAVNLSLLLVTALVAIALGWAGWQCLRASRQPHEEPQAARKRFVAKVAGWLYLVSALGALLVGLPMLVLPPCV